MKPFKYQCAYCDKKYKQEKAFLAHSCDEQKRTEELKTIRGQRAYNYYEEWNRIKRYSIPPATTFITSNNYKAFIRFAKFVRDVRLPLPNEYIKVMVERGLTPQMWTDNLAYKHYIEHLDKRMSPTKQAMLTVDTIFKICERYDIDDTTDFFDHIIPNEFIQCVVRRQLSAWVLFNSKKFIDFYMNRLSEQHKNIFDGIYPPEKWAEKFKHNKKDVAEIKKIVNELEL